MTAEQTGILLRALSITRVDEFDCRECLDRVDQLAEVHRRGSLIPIELDPVAHHLDLCVECREEFHALLRALARLDNEGDQDSSATAQQVTRRWTEEYSLAKSNGNRIEESS